MSTTGQCPPTTNRKRAGKVTEESTPKKAKLQPQGEARTHLQIIDDLYDAYVIRSGYGGAQLGREEFTLTLPPQTHCVFEQQDCTLRDVRPWIESAESRDSKTQPATFKSQPPMLEHPPGDDATFIRWAAKEIQGYDSREADRLLILAATWRSVRGQIKESSVQQVVGLLKMHLARLKSQVEAAKMLASDLDKAGERAAGISEQQQSVVKKMRP